jgi:hypothetical protein
VEADDAVICFGEKNRMITLPKNIDRWLPAYLSGTRRRIEPGETVHLLLCIADHFEPQHANASTLAAMSRVDRWVSEYPRLFSNFRDSDDRPPQHTFFYPMELYEPAHLDALAELCRGGFGEVEVHLHHENDTADALRQRLLEYKQMLASRHGLLSRRRSDGEIVYGFVHGNWALANSHPQGRFCGVDDELDVLRETGCYADFTFPSAPDPTQPRTINRIYHERSLMLIQGPLLLDWRNRKWGVVPRIENGCLQASQPPTPQRVDLWLRARVQVASRPDWFFVKLHTHGAAESNEPMLLGEPMRKFHEALGRRSERDRNFHFHYVTARQMYNLARAAAAKFSGGVEQARDFEIVSAINQASRVRA